MIDPPTFPTQQRVDALASVAHANFSNLADASTLRCIVAWMGSVVERGSSDQEQARRAAYTRTVGVDQEVRECTLTDGPQSFFWTTF